MYLDPVHGLIHIDCDLSIYDHKSFYIQLEAQFPKLTQCPAYNTSGHHRGYIVRCPQLTKHVTLQYHYTVCGKRRTITLFELRPSGGLFPVAGKNELAGKKAGYYRPVRPITGSPQDVPTFSLQELEAIYSFAFQYISRNYRSGRVVANFESFHTVQQVKRAEARPLRPIKDAETLADLAYTVLADANLLHSLFEKFGVAVAVPGKSVHCPFHGPNNHPSMTIMTKQDGTLLIRDWHDKTDYDVVSLYAALRTDEPGCIEKQVWWEALNQLAHEFGHLPSEDEVRNQLAATIEAVHTPSVWEGATKGSVETIQEVFKVVLAECAKWNNLAIPLATRVVVEKVGKDIRLVSRALNFLTVSGVLEKAYDGSRNRSAAYRINPNAKAEDIRFVVEALTENGRRNLLQANQNDYALLIDARKAYATFKRQSDEWEAENKRPEWHKQVLAKEEVAQLEAQGIEFVPVRINKPDRKAQDEKLSPDSFVAKHLVGKRASEIYTTYPEVLPSLPFTLDWKKCSNGCYRVVGPDAHCFRLWVLPNGRLEWVLDPRPQLGVLGRKDLPPMPEEYRRAIEQRLFEEARRLKIMHVA